MSSVIADAQQRMRFGKRKGPECVMLWRTSLNTAVEDPEFVTMNAADLAGLLLEAVRTYDDSQSLKAVLDVARQAAGRSDAFVKALAGAVVKQASVLGPGKPVTLTRNEMFGLITLARVAVQKLDPATAKKAVVKLMEMQGMLADALTGTAVKWNVVSRQLRKELKSQEPLISDVIELAKTPPPTATPGSPHVLARALLDYAGLHPTVQSTTHQEVLGIWCDKVVNGRERVTLEIAACYARLLKALTSDDFTNKVVPAVTRSLRRTSDVAMTALSALLAAAPGLDISSHAVELAGILVQQMRTKESVRPLAVTALQHVAQHTQDAAVLGQLVGLLKGLLDGSAEGKIKVVAERVVLTQGLTGVASSPCSKDACAPLADQVVAFCMTAAKEEANDEARGSLLACASAWLAHVAPGSACLAQVVAVLGPGIRDSKEGLRRQALKTAAQMAASCPQLRSDLAGLVEPAAKVVADALAKPALRLDGVLALAAAVQLAAPGSPGDELLEREKVWSGALKPDSSLLGLSGAGKLAAADAAHLVDVAECLLAQHGARVAAVTGAEELVCSLLAGLTLHHAKELRAAAAAAVSRLASEGSRLRPLAAALTLCASSRAAITGLAVAPDASGEDAVLQAGTLASRLAAAIVALVPSPRDKPLDIPEFCALLLAAHHPAITQVLPRKAAANVWKTIQSKLTGQTKALPGMAVGITQVLFGPLGVGSSSTTDIQAAQSALGACMAMAPASMMPPVQEALAQLLDRTSHDALTQEELDIWATPRGMLSSERVPEGVYVGQVVESKNVRKARGRMKMGGRAFGGDDDESDDEPAPVKRAAAAAPPARPAPAANGAAARTASTGPVKKDAAARQAEWRQAKLAEEEQVRSRVDAIRAKIELGTTTMCAVVAGNTRAAGLRLEPLQQLVMPLLSSTIAGASAFNAVCGLGSCMAAPLHLQALSTAAALRLVVLAQEGNRGVRPADVPAASQVSDVVHAMRKVTGDRRQLSGPAYRFLFPILQAVLSSPVHTALHDEALALVALHCGPGLEVPRAASLTLLQHLLGVIPAYRDRVTGLLKQLATGCKEEEEVVAACRGVLHASGHVRTAALASLQELPCLAEPGQLTDLPEVVCMLLLACHDPVQENAAVAQALWNQAGCTAPPDFVDYLVTHVTQCTSEVQQAAGAALSHAVKSHPGSVSNVLSVVIGSYQSDDDVLPRRGCATALKSLAADLGDAEVTLALDFLIGNGLADPNDKVREEMVNAGTAIVDAHGASHAPKMLPLFESHLDQRSGGAHSAEEAAHDLVREGVVVLMGTLARHLPADDPKRAAVVDILVSVLSTPSEAVQRAVSNCMAPLMAPLSVNKEAIDQLVAKLLAALTKGKTYGERRGAAFGIAGLVKGLGYMSMTNCGIMDALKTAVEDKKDPAAREGALMAFECLSDKLGKLFEPYIIKILPLLLNCFGDPIPEVRAATEDAARMIMGQLTGSGVKLVLPSLLKGLEDKVWRTKQGSVQLLGSMAHCAPKQLGSCLPTIVPRLSEVLSDPHPKVQAAANESLKEVGSVIRNPEVSSLVPALLKAIADPNNATRPALDVLLETVFVNTIDAASLALIVPVIHRGLRDRTGDTKKRAARIAGNMASLVNDPKDMVPYVPLLRPELQKALVDPLPDVRAMAARAMGSLMQGMGTEQFGDLVPWLMTTLRSEASSVERSGAAQGLAEVLAVLGPNHLEALLPELLAGCSDRTSPSAREGHLVLLHYLPVTLEKAFHSYLGRVLPAVLDGLADESEGVRDAALAAGRILVDHYATSALPLLLPAVEDGVFQESWRIRQSSVKLLGKLLFKVAGTTGNIVLDGGSDDEGAAEEGYNEAIIQALGLDKRNEVLARLYICRSDPQYPVRTEALHVWKSVVPNTPKTLGQLLPTLMNLIIESLADPLEDRQIMAGRCLGELVRKMSERVLHRIIPILVQGVHAPAVSTRQGVCLGMKEVLENISRQQMAENLTDLLPAVQAALCDEDAGVREAAGSAFSIMFKGGASSAVDAVVPSMLEGLSTAKYSESVEGLRVILAVRPQMVNSVLPKLMKQPLQLHSLRAVRELAEVAAPVIQHHIKSLIPPLLTLANKGTGEKEQAAAAAVAAVATAVPDDSVFLLLQELRKSLDESARRHAAAVAIAGYAAARKTSAEPLMEHVPTLLDALISLFADDDPALVTACWQAVEALTGLIPKEEAGNYVRCVKEAVATAKETERRKRTGKALVVAGLCLPKALSPLLPIYLQGVLQGASTDIREQAAEGLGELVSVSSEESVKPYVVQITGPLIRIMGDRFPAQIKAAILVTLGVLINKASLGLKPFVPQLQTTFLKCLADAADGVRAQAAINLGELSRMSPRVEQLANELCSNARVAEVQIRDSYLVALAGLLSSSGERLSEGVLATLTDNLLDMGKLSGDDEQFRYALANCLGALSRHVSEAQLKTILTWGPLAAAAPPGSDRQLHACVLATVVKAAGVKLKDLGLVQPVMEAVQRFSRDTQHVLFKVAAGRAVARLAAVVDSVIADACNVLGCLMLPDQASEVQRQSLLAVRRMAAALAAAGQTGALEKQLGQIIPPMCAIASTTSGPLKNTCEISLARVLQLEDGTSELVTRYLASGPGGTVRTTLTDPFMRRVSKLTEDTELFAQEEF